MFKPSKSAKYNKGLFPFFTQGSKDRFFFNMASPIRRRYGEAQGVDRVKRNLYGIRSDRYSKF